MTHVRGTYYGIRCVAQIPKGKTIAQMRQENPYQSIKISYLDSKGFDTIELSEFKEGGT